MLRLNIGRWFLILAAFFVTSSFVYPQRKDSETGHKVIDTDASLNEKRVASELSQLIGILDRGGPDTVWALERMRRLGVHATPSIPRLCLKLGDANHSIRRVAIEVLESIGEESIAPLRQILQTASGRKRAAVVSALIRLKGIEFEEFDQLVQDPDPRVRAVAAKGLASFGQQGIPLLIRLLADPQVSVAFEATTSLGANREDPNLAIPALTRALWRAKLDFGAATALAAYGKEARRSIPWVITAQHHDSTGEDNDPSIDTLLNDLGPPDSADISMLMACLKLKNPLARQFAALKLGELGEDASDAAEALAAAAVSTFDEGIAIDRSPLAGRGWPHRQADPYWSAAAECLGAFWKVIRDPAAAINLFETCIKIAGKDVFFPWRDDFPKDYQKFVVNPMSEDEDEEGSIRDDDVPRCKFSRWSTGGHQWSCNETFDEPKGYAVRPDDETLENVKVVWNPPKMDRLGKSCKFSGRLVGVSKGDKALVPVDWFQGVGFCLARNPGAHLDWTIEIDRRDSVFNHSVITREGQFEFSVAMKELKPRRDVARSFQVGIALGSYEEDGNTVTVSWANIMEVLPSSVAMLTIPEAPSLPQELELLNRSCGWPRGNSNTVDLINSVNALHRLGKEQALQTLQRYVELDDAVFHYPDHQTLFWIIALLFEPVSPDESIPLPGIAFLQQGDDGQGEWPLELVDDVPFVIPGSSDPEHVDEPSTLIAWAWRHGILREQPLVPKTNPLEAAEVVLRSRRIRAYTERDEYQESLYAMVRAQAIRMTDALIEPIPRRTSFGGPRDTRGQAFNEFIHWQLRRIDAWTKQIHWDTEKQRFVGREFD